MYSIDLMFFKEYLTEADILLINNTIKPDIWITNFDISKNILTSSYIQSRNLLLIYNNFNYNVLTVIDLITKDIKVYLIIKPNRLIKFIKYINYKKNIYKDYEHNYKNNKFLYEYEITYENKTIYKFNLYKCINIYNDIKLKYITPIKKIKRYKNNNIYNIVINSTKQNNLCYIYDFYFYNYKIYKVSQYKYYIKIFYKNILI